MTKIEILNKLIEGSLNIKFLSSSLRKDRDIALAAVSNDGWALEYADESLKNDKEILEACKK